MTRHPFGWSVIAYADLELGVGEAGRRVASSVRQSGLPTELVAVRTGSLSRHDHAPQQQVTDRVGYDSAVICVNADQLPHVVHELDLGSVRGDRIGVWFWELEVFPERFHGSFALVHEVWVASEFTRAAVAAATDMPVRTIPLPMPAAPAEPTRFSRSALGLPADRFVFLTNFDYFSSYRRKNPIAAIRAYAEAFSPSDGACLVVKSINGHLRPEDADRVKAHAHGRPDILFLDHYVSSAAMLAMIELADVYVSLHRSEGYGLNLADAMVRGTPVIATGYSGNLEFMDAGTALLVGHDLVEVGPDAFPYDPDAIWADPHVGEAAQAMRLLFDDAAAGRALADRARDSTSRFSLERAGREVRDLLLPELAPEGSR
ncbi:glycosyltransferase involved in cell wall biosynthesis [Marmoricola sp. URHA0025 HA25]